MDPAQLFKEHRDALLRFLVRLAGDRDRAEDALQETYLTLVRSPPRHEGNLRAWLYRVATNVVLDDYRALRRLVRGGKTVQDVAGESDPATDAEEREARRLMRRAMDRLRSRERAILLLRAEGFTHREIAQKLGTTTSSVGTMLSRALRKLRATRELRLLRDDREDRPSR